MAIADAEPKKGEVDHTSTGSSSGTNKDMKKLTHGPVKYSSLKDFSFSVSDVWDDLNICIFLECCHANIAELRDHNCAEENKVWEKIAKSGLERAGSISCFNVNYCLELAKCLKNFVNKNQTKMMDNEIFKILYDNVVDLLPHFEPGSAKVPRRRSGSQDKHKILEHTKKASSQDSSEIVVEPFKSPLDSRSALKKILNVLSKFDPDDLMKSNARSAVWKEVRARTGDFFGLSVNPKAFIEGYKDSVISTIKSTPGADRDAQLRAKIFLKLASDMLPYFDYIAPKSVKKSDFLLPEVESREPSPPPKTEPKKRKLEVATEITEPAEDPPAEDPVHIPEPSGVTRSPAPRTYQRKKRTAEDDPLSFLDDWTTSLEETDSPPDETESESKENEHKPEDQPQEKAEEPTNSQTVPDEPPTKRIRRPRVIKAPEDQPKKVLPTRQRTKKLESSTITVPSEPEKKTNITTPPVPAASTSATTAGSVVPAKKIQAKEPSPFRIPEPAKVGSTVADDASDSEVEDVPLIGNRFRVHREDKPRGRRPGKPGQGQPAAMNLQPVDMNLQPVDMNLQPVVRLELIDVDGMVVSRPSTSAEVSRPSSSTEVSRPKARPGRPPKRQISPPRDASPIPVESTIVRRRGRPPKNANTSTVSRFVRPAPRPEPSSRRDAPPSTSSSSSSSALVRPSRSQAPAPYSSSAMTVRSYEPPVPVNGQAVRPDDYALRPSLDVSPPEWFERFVYETRKQEMWKVHQLMKMQNELLDAESRKRNVLERILSALSDRYDRH